MNKYKINKGYIVQEIDNKMTIFDGDNSILYTFNETATYIFKKIKKGLNKDEASKALSEKYGIKLSRALKDTNTIISDLFSKKIIIPK